MGDKQDEKNSLVKKDMRRKWLKSKVFDGRFSKEEIAKTNKKYRKSMRKCWMRKKI